MHNGRLLGFSPQSPPNRGAWYGVVKILHGCLVLTGYNMIQDANEAQILASIFVTQKLISHEEVMGDESL